MHPTLSTILFFLPACSLGFSLDDAGPYWNYTTASLAPTTSQKCKDAYSAEIQCDNLFIRHIYGRPLSSLPDEEEAGFADIVARTCTTTCKTSLTTYIANVQEACKSPGDAALRSNNDKGEDVVEKVPVDIIGRILQSWLLETCAKSERGEWCLETVSGYLPPDLAGDCNWDCAVAHWWITHMYPESEWSFDGPYTEYSVGNETYEWVDKRLLLGPVSAPFVDSINNEAWESIKKCDRDGDIDHPPFDTGFSDRKMAVSTTAATSTATATGTSSKSSGPAASASDSSSVSGFGALPTQTGAGTPLAAIQPVKLVLGISIPIVLLL